MAAVDEALLEHERAPEPFELARTLLLLGELHRRRKHKQAARDALERALGIFDGLGANLWSKRAVADLDRLGKRPPSRWELSPTEQQVAERVAMGMRNQEVADALFMSTKTVAHHLTKVYEKLGIRSRTELASRLAAAQSNLAGASPSRD